VIRYETVRRLHALGIRTSLITGDNEQAARHFARAVGIEEVHARVLPAEKAQMIRKLQEHARGFCRKFSPGVI